MMALPTINLSPLQTGLPVDEQKVAKEILEALTTTGFTYIKNHGIHKSLIEKVNSNAKAFFSLPDEIKDKYARKAENGYNHGYVANKLEFLNSPVPDLKQTWNTRPQLNIEEFWPMKEMPGYKETLQTYAKEVQKLAKTVLKLIAIGLEFEDPLYFVKRHSFTEEKNSSMLRCNFYHPVAPKDVEEDQLRCGEHTDYGTITFLYISDAPGLQVKLRNGEFVEAQHQPGTLLLNTGDCLQRWTADKLVSNRHRVRAPTEPIEQQKDRQSIAFFVHPDDDCMVECTDGSNKYEPINAREYIYSLLGQMY